MFSLASLTHFHEVSNFSPPQISIFLMPVASLICLETELIKLLHALFGHADKSEFINTVKDRVQGNIC